MGDAARKAALFDAIAVTGKALSSGKRLELLDLLAQGERSVEDLAGAAGMKVSNTSAQLRMLAAVSDATHPDWRASALGVYRFWRDSGYAIGALIGGITAALASLDAAIGVAAVLTAVSGILAWAFMRETHPRPVADDGSARATAG